MSDNALENQNGLPFPRQPPYKEHTADFLSIVVIIHGNDGKTGAFVLWQRTGVI